MPPPDHPTQARLDVRFAFSDNAPGLLASLTSTLLVSTYNTGNLIAVSGPPKGLALSFHSFERPMGVAVKPGGGGIAVAARNQVWFLGSAPDVTARMEPRGVFDASYFARYAHYTGDFRCHEIGWVGGELWLVNTRFSCLCTLHPGYHFAARWKPRFVTALAPEDRCHLNGMAVADGAARVVSVMGETNAFEGWRPGKATGGCLIDVASGETISRGLTMPHSPRIAGGRLFVLNSGLGRLERVDPATGARDVVAELPGYVRGLAIHDSLAFIGLSKVRPSSSWDGVPIAADPDRLKCGVWVVDLETGAEVGRLEFLTGVSELFDVQLLPGVRQPYVAGPLADSDAGPPPWTVKPAP